MEPLHPLLRLSEADAREKQPEAETTVMPEENTLRTVHSTVPAQGGHAVDGSKEPPAGGAPDQLPETPREGEEEEAELVVHLDDILSQVPTENLRAGLHDPETEIRFHVDELCQSIAKGRVAVPVSRLAQIRPDIFEAPDLQDRDLSIRLPLQKLIQQLGFVDHGRRPRPPERKGHFAAITNAPPLRSVSEIWSPLLPQTAPKLTVVPAPSADAAERPEVISKVVEFSPAYTAVNAAQLAPELPAVIFQRIPPAEAGKLAGELASEVTEAAASETTLANHSVAPFETFEEFLSTIPKGEEAKPTLVSVDVGCEARLEEIDESLTSATPTADPAETVANAPGDSLAEEVPAHAPEPPVVAENLEEPAPALPTPASEPIPIEPAPKKIAAEVSAPAPVLAPQGRFEAPRVSFAPLEPVRIPLIRPPAPRPPVFIRAEAARPPGAPAPEAPSRANSEANGDMADAGAAVLARPALQPPALFGMAAAPLHTTTAVELEPLVQEPVSEVSIPPLALSRFNQSKLQGIFLTDDQLDLAKMARLAAEFPGIHGCMIVVGDELTRSGEWPEALGSDAARSLWRAHEDALPDAALFPVEALTLHGAYSCLTLFQRPDVLLGVTHSVAGFLPGVREKLKALADELAPSASGR